jgi:L-2-hydroxyglutarate oxidase
MNYDFTIVGAGIVGLSTAYKLSEAFPDANLLVLEKEKRVAAHQSGRNSGVIHSGIYYEPNSYRAKNCVNGRHQLVQFCEDYGITHEICGKIIVATQQDQLETLDEIFKNGQINSIEGIRKISIDEMREIEPYCTGIQAIHVPCTGIVDYVGVCKKLGELITQKNGTLKLGREVRQIHTQTDAHSVEIQTKNESFSTRYLINCAGLYSDHLAQMAGVQTDIQIVPFRGEYYRLTPNAEHMVQGLIYPIPYKDFPFLGVHFTKMAVGGVECGPNAVFSFKREGYSKVSFDASETLETAAFSGFWNLAKQHWKMGLAEYYRSFSKKAFVRDLQKLIPSIRSQHLEPAAPGVRAMALTPDGDIVNDFQFEETSNAIHVLNAPSPAATAGLAIGDEITKRAETVFGL